MPDFRITFGPDDDRQTEHHATIDLAARRCRELETLHAEKVEVEHRGKMLTPQMVTAFSPARGRLMRRA
jgi:hypothetical protein